MKAVKFNIPAVILSVLMIGISTVNFMLSNDSLSLGIFIFLGLGFTTATAQPADKENKILQKRLNKYALYFFAGALIFFGYWLLAAKLKWI
jgi:hypothetical protein